MNEKIQAIFLKLIRDLKKDRWTPSPDWEITIKSEKQVSLQKEIPVTGGISGTPLDQTVLASIDVKLASTDQITYFPEYTIYANIAIEGVTSEDITYKSEANAAFTVHDFNKDDKIKKAAGEIARSVHDYIENQFNNYCTNHEEEFQSLSNGNPRIDDDEN